MAFGTLWVGGGVDLEFILLLALIASSPILALPRFCCVSVVIASTPGASGGVGGCGGLGLVLALLDLEAILKVSGFRFSPTVPAMIRAPDGGGGGFGWLLPPVITGSAGGGAEEGDFPSITCVMNCCWRTLVVPCGPRCAVICLCIISLVSLRLLSLCAIWACAYS